MTDFANIRSNGFRFYFKHKNKSEGGELGGEGNNVQYKVEKQVFTRG